MKDNPNFPQHLPLTGMITRLSGPVVNVTGLKNIRLYDVVRVGELGLIGEVIRLSRGQATVQVYENTDGVRVGEPVTSTGLPLVAHLGPGLLGSVYDGLQRPLDMLAEKAGYYIQRGLSASPLNEEKRWHFTPSVSGGDVVGPGDVLGIVPETGAIKHRILVPPDQGGRVVKIAEGDFQINDVVALLDPETRQSARKATSGAAGDARNPYQEISLCQRWPVRQPRPVHAYLPQREPLISGTRIIDVLFPVARGGSAIIPGGFGTGKTVCEHSLARWSDIDVVVYVGCGERGNEMTAVLEEFPHLEDPRTGAPLMERTVLIANTSNMPVAAREASIYTGITIAEYYRDMGYDVLLLADSTSRWGEALREISGRLEEMPGEEGYPAYLAARLAEFYERSGRVLCLGAGRETPRESGVQRKSGLKQSTPELADQSFSDPGSYSQDVQNETAPEHVGSVTVVGAVSPPGGDFSEPITQHSMRVTGTFWALDYDLSRRRHFPAINWTNSYSLYSLTDWYHGKVAGDWAELTAETRALLQRETELLEIVRLVGPDALDDNERAILSVARMLREDFLQQSAYDPVDRFCDIRKAYWMLKAILDFYQRTHQAVNDGVPLAKILGGDVTSPTTAATPATSALKGIQALLDEISHMKEYPPDQAEEKIQKLMERVRFTFEELSIQSGKSV